ncbi:MAG: DEAD/DEAH box helicase [Succinivibrionaceae bacterium]|nr:DEAD/DEAH box helicase [Succinivibrionaceae bacterium]
MNFGDLSLTEVGLRAAAAQGWTEPTPIQCLAVPKAMEGFDILAGAPTGTGKSAAFLLPIIERLAMGEKPGPRVIIIEPTRELARQVCDLANSLLEGAGLFLEAATITGGESREIELTQDAAIIAATPGRLVEFLRRRFLNTDGVEILVIDEADRMFDLGMRDDVAFITRHCSYRFQTMLFSATIDSEAIDDFAEQVMNDPFEVRLGGAGGDSGRLPTTLRARAYFVSDPLRKGPLICELMRTAPGKSIVFVRTKERVPMVARMLRSAGFCPIGIQGDMAQSDRNSALRRFDEGQDVILVATDIAARGLDIKGVRYVFNYDMPQTVATYIHRAGRTARAGESGTAISLVESRELALLGKVERFTSTPVERREAKDLSQPFPAALPTPRRKEPPIHAASKRNAIYRERHERIPHKKVRLRDRKNKGRPDFEQKRLRREQRRKAAPDGQEA